MIESTFALQSVIEQCQQTLNTVNSDLTVLSAVVSILEEQRYHVTPVPQYNLSDARGRLQALRSVRWRLRFCRMEAERTARHGRPVPAEDVQAFHDYLALALQDLAGVPPLAAAV
jgi:hypothetical protein